MKKQFLTVAVAALALAGCSKSETVEVASNRAIGFENFVGKATRAGETTDETIKSGFGVFGGSEDSQDLFSDVKVYHDGGKWTYDDTKYWMPGKTYKFAAYAPQAKGVITPTWNYNNNKLTFAITCDATNQNDLVYGAATKSYPTPEDLTDFTPEVVNFTMKHILSKLEFKIKAGDIESDAKLKITDVTIAGKMNTQNTYDGTTWPKSEQSADVIFNGAPNDGITTATNTHSLGVYYVIPQTLTGNVTVSFTVTLFAGDTQIGNPTPLTATISTPTWAQDYVYTYTATVNQENIEGGKPIEFTGSVDDWTDGQTGGGDITINQ